MDTRTEKALQSLDMSMRDSSPSRNSSQASDEALDRSDESQLNLENDHEPHHQAPRRQYLTRSEMKKEKYQEKKKVKTLDQMIASLAKSNLKEEKDYGLLGRPTANGVQKTKGKRRLNKKESKAKRLSEKAMKQFAENLGDSSLVKEPVPGKEPREKQTGATRESRSRSGMLPLGFDGHLLRSLGDASSFMNNDEIRAWIKSVWIRHLEGWYRNCICDPDNQEVLKAAQSDPRDFSRAVIRGAIAQHRQLERRGALFIKLADVLKPEQKLPNGGSFVQYTAAVACLVVQDGQRGGKFAHCDDVGRLHRAAVLLMISVIMDLTVNMGYFIRLVFGIENANLADQDEQILLALGGAPTSSEPAVQHPRGLSAIPRTVQVPADKFESVSETFEEVQQSSGSRILVHPPTVPTLARYIVLVGSAGQMDEAETFMRTLMESSTQEEASSGMDLS